VLQHDAAGADADPLRLSGNPGDKQFRGWAGELGRIVMFRNPEAVKAASFCLLRQL
jgi:hypothetical protein